MIKKTFILLMILLMSLTGSAASFAHEQDNHATLDISQAWARKTGSRTASAAVYFILKNTSDVAESLVGVSSTRAAMTTIHRSFEQDGIMRMEMQGDVEIDPKSSVSFEPGGLHIMLMRLDKPLLQGQVFPLTLTFKDAGEVTIYVEVTGIAGPQK